MGEREGRPKIVKIFLVLPSLMAARGVVCSHVSLHCQVMHRQLLRPGVVLGSFKLDVATVLSQQGSHFFILGVN